MRLVTLRTPAGTRAGLVDADRGEVVELDRPDVGAVLAADPGLAEVAGTAARPGAPRHPLATADLATLVPRPAKVVCLGLNYASHIAEMGRQRPAHPTLFAKFALALVGARDDIVLPRVSERVDWEVELCLVVGRPVRHADERAAAAAIAGYTAANDVSMRDWQRRTSQYLQGKTFERSTPVGPALVTPDELPGGGADLELRCEVDGVEMQRGRSSDLLFGPAEIVAYISRIVTLEPGDLILTGTPAGVGDGRTPPVYLRPGQVVRSVVEGVGELVNTCVAEPA